MVLAHGRVGVVAPVKSHSVVLDAGSEVIDGESRAQRGLGASIVVCDRVPMKSSGNRASQFGEP